MEARIRVDLEKKKGEINRNIYGHFIEHLARCIYGGIYEEDSPLSDENGFRRDVLEAAKMMRVPLLRWPGGNFASNYHWVDGIGPKEKRPKKLDTAWMAEENNHFGTDEFLKYCNLTGAEPCICLNLGTGSLEETLAWVEYCNYDGDTHYVALRKKYGRKTPYRVKYWGLGNEAYGGWQHGCCSGKEYAQKAREFSQFIKKIDPNTKTIAVGADNPDWDIEVIKGAGETIDYISIHMYFSPSEDDYYMIVGLPHLVEKRLRLLEDAIEIGESCIKKEKPIEIAFDEWNIWRKPPQEEENYSLADGLFACGVFHILHKHSNRVTMANLAQLVNVIGAIHTEKQGIILTPIYHAYSLYSNNTGRYLVESEVDCKKFTTSYRGTEIENVPYLDVSATVDENIIYLAAINRHREKAFDADVSLGKVSLKKKGEVFRLIGPKPLAYNTLGKEKIKVEKEDLNVSGSDFSYQFPPFSATILKLRMVSK